MDFDLSAEQAMLKEQARRFLSEHAPADKVRAVLEGRDNDLPQALLQQFAEQGWLAAGITQEYGGLGLGPVETCVVAEELGRCLAPSAFASTVYLVAEAVALSTNESLKADYLPRIASGELTGCFAHADLPGEGRCVVREGRLSGAKAPVLDGMITDLALVRAAEETGADALYIVELDREGVERHPLKTIDPTRPAAVLRFSDAEARHLPIAGIDPVGRLRAHAAVYFAFEQIGGAERCLEMACDYALQRHAFGWPIGRYQAIKHKLADVYVAIEIARSNAYFAASALESESDEVEAAAAAARVAACDAYWLAAKENIQTHGGIGVTWEMDCHLHYRRAHLLSLIVGPPDAWRQRLANALTANWRTDGVVRPQ